MTRLVTLRCLLFAASLSLSPLFAAGQGIESRPSTQPTAATTDDQADRANSDDHDFGSPGLGMMAGMMICLMLVLLGAGAMIGLAVLGVIATLLTVGILSTSGAVALAKQSPRAGLRVLFLEVGGVLGVPSGATILWIITHLFHAQIAFGWVLLIGGLAGAAVGVLTAMTFNYCWGKIVQWIAKTSRTA